MTFTESEEQENTKWKENDRQLSTTDRRERPAATTAPRAAGGRFVAGDETARFWSKVDRVGHGECWVWTGRLTPDGYGRFDVRPRPGHPGEVRAHRWAWEQANGRLSAELTLDHLVAPDGPCTSTACVRPDHLEPVTNAENLRRRHARALILRLGLPEADFADTREATR